MLSKSYFFPKNIWPTRSKLGEGVVWIEAEQSVYYVDIHGQHIHRYCLINQQKQTWDVPQKPTFIFPTNRNNVLLCGMEDGLYWFYSSDGHVRLWFPFKEEYPNNRINDGYIDAYGRLWFGSMDSKEEETTGALYLLDWQNTQPVLIKHDEGYCVLNGPVISKKRQILYCSHSNAHEIFSFQIEDDATLVDKQLFVKEMDGYPDGMALDENDNLWVCLYQGHKINVYSPEGEKIHTISFPCPNLTKIAFGGSDHRTAFVTSATAGIPNEQIKQFPQAGGLFSFKVKIAGQKQNIFEIPKGLRLKEQVL